MKKLKITTKITIWYTVFLLILTGCALFTMAYTGNMRASELAKTRLMDSVSDAGEEVQSVGKNFIIDDDLDFYDDGVYIGVYDSDGELLEGRRPIELSQLPELQERHMNRLQDEEGSTWYVYDSRFDLDGNTMWVRGIVKDFAQQSTFTFMLRISTIVLPILVILAAIGGYVITRRAFRPVRKIIETVEEISGDVDLSRRIELDDMQKWHAPGNYGREEGADAPKDEIYSLAYTFNGMFDKLEKAFEEEKQFTSDVSHELRTPLAVIISQSDYAKEDDEYREHALEVINREAKRMAGLVNRLLTIARSDAGRLKLNMENLDFSALCQGVAEQQRPLAEEKHMELTADIKPGIYVSGDEEMLIRVLLNLVDNAVKYGSRNICSDGSCSNIMANNTVIGSRDKGIYDTGNTGVKTEDLSQSVFDVGEAGHINLKLEKKKAFAKLTVEDDGPGICEEDLKRIWERFYRADSARSDDGAGIGLSMVKALVKAHGGKVEAESIIGVGSRFMIYIPLNEGSEYRIGMKDPNGDRKEKREYTMAED